MRLKDFSKSGHPQTLFSAFLYFDISFTIWVLLGALGVFIAQEFGLTATEKGLMVAIPILSGALLRIPVGMLVDHLGPKKTGMLGMGITAFPLLWGWSAASTMPEIYLMGLLLGVAGASFAVALPLAGRWYPPRYQGLAMGIAGAGNSGTVLAVLLGPRLAEVVGWHGVMGLALIPLGVTFLVYALLAKDSPDQPRPKPLRRYWLVLRESDTYWFSFFYSVTFGGFVGLASFLVIFFHDQYGLSKVMAGNFAALCVFAGSFFRPLGGLLADKIGGVRALTLLYAVVAASMVGVSALPPLWTVTVFLFVGMTALGMGNGSIFQLVPQRFRKEIGVMTGLVGAAGGVGGFFLPAYLGYFKDVMGTYAAGFLLFASLAALALVSLRIVQRRWRTTWGAPEVSEAVI
ncbi:MAG: NarK/NasA family nitrate transporter [Nitrospirae bacterium]|nr:NarK/NasA family nitrate transporter [Nitrospirota bacterium]